MANTHIVFGRIKNGYERDVLSIESQTIANNGTSTPSNAALNHVSVTAVGGNTWVAFSNATGTPSAANTSYRMYVPMGTTIQLGANGSIKIHSLDA